MTDQAGATGATGAPGAGIDINHLMSFVGKEMVSSWREITQDEVIRFARVTGDEQWIHVDAERARRESPYQETIAHGFFTLSLISTLLRDAVGSIEGTRLGVNYGLNKVRFPSPVPVGSLVRARCTLQKLDPADGGVQATWNVVVERDGAAKPCCVAEWLVRYLL